MLRFLLAGATLRIPGPFAMPVICPKCSAIRPADAQAPAWQCPACGVAYAKAGAMAASASADANASASAGAIASAHRRPASTGAATSARPWGKALAALLLVCVVWGGYKAFLKTAGGSVSSIAVRVSGDASAEQLSTLAATVGAGDVVIYSAAWCVNCAAAKQWMSQYGFKYQDCDVEVRADCASQFRALAGDGVPYLIVKGHHMKEGFDSDEFITALRR